MNWYKIFVLIAPFICAAAVIKQVFSGVTIHGRVCTLAIGKE